MIRGMCVFLLVALAGAQEAKFPARLASDADLKIARNRVQTSLLRSCGAQDNKLVVGDASKISANMLLSIDAEIVNVVSIEGNILSVERGFDGTVSAPHGAGRTVSAQIDAWHHNALAQEVKAIENALGPGLSNVQASGKLPDFRDFGGVAAVSLATTCGGTGQVLSCANTMLGALAIGDRIAIFPPVENGAGSVVTSRFVDSSTLTIKSVVSGNVEQLSIGDQVTVSGQTRDVVDLVDLSTVRVYPAFHPEVSGGWTFRKKPQYRIVQAIDGTVLTVSQALSPGVPAGSVLLKAPNNIAALRNALNSGSSIFVGDGDYYIAPDTAAPDIWGLIEAEGFRGTLEFGGRARLVFVDNRRTGLAFLRASNAVFRGVRIAYLNQPTEHIISNGGYGAFAVRESENVHIQGLVVEAAYGGGLTVAIAKNLSVAHSSVQRTTTAGFQIEDCERCTVIGSSAEITGDDNFAFHDRNDTPVEGSFVNAVSLIGRHSATCGINLTGTHDASISNFLIDDAAGAGISVQESAVFLGDSPRRISFSSGQIRNVRGGFGDPQTSGYGVVVGNSFDVSLSGIRVESTANSCIRVVNQSHIPETAFSVSDVSCSTSGFRGVDVQMTNGHFRFDNIFVADTAERGFLVSATKTVDGGSVGIQNASKSGSPNFAADFVGNGAVSVRNISIADNQNAATGIGLVESANSAFEVENVVHRIDHGTFSLSSGSSEAYFGRINGKIYGGSRAVKTAAGTSCTTAASIGATCESNIAWTGQPFGGTGYSPVCSIEALTGFPEIVSIVGKSSESLTVRIAASTPATASGIINCIAILN